MNDGFDLSYGNNYLNDCPITSDRHTLESVSARIFFKRTKSFKSIQLKFGFHIVKEQTFFRKEK